MYRSKPRYPLISEIKQLLLDSYYGREFVEHQDTPVIDKEEKKRLRKNSRKKEVERKNAKK